MEEAPGDQTSVMLVVALFVGVLTAIIGYFVTRKQEPEGVGVGGERGEGVSAAARAAPGQGVGRGKGRKPLHKHAADKAGASQQHPLEVNVLKGHGDQVTGLAFSNDGRALATACEDGVVRVFKLEDVASKNLKFLRISVPPGTTPKGVAFGEGAGHLLVSGSDPRGGCLLMFGQATGKEAAQARAQGRLPPPEVKWERRLAHDGKEILTIVSAPAAFGSGDGSTIAATCTQDGTDVRLWHVSDGKNLGKVDSNQLQNTMAALSPDGRFLAVAAFTSDVKIWELLYGKDGSVREIAKVMQLKGHKSAVTWLCFSSDSTKAVTTSKDGTIKLWNLDVRYTVSEDPKCLATIPIPDPPPSTKQRPHVLERIALSPDGTVLAAAFGATLEWIDMASGEVLATAEGAHDGHIHWAAWSPKPHNTEHGQTDILATCGADKRVKLWMQPSTS